MLPCKYIASVLQALELHALLYNLLLCDLQLTDNLTNHRRRSWQKDMRTVIQAVRNSGQGNKPMQVESSTAIDESAALEHGNTYCTDLETAPEEMDVDAMVVGSSSLQALPATAALQADATATLHVTRHSR